MEMVMAAETLEDRFAAYVDVARQYCGELGKQNNCQVAVSLSVTNEQASLPIAYRLYLPQAWADDPARCRKAGVPEAVVFQTKPQIAPAQIRAALAQGVPPGVVLADAGYSADMDFQQGLLALDLAYVVGILPNTSVWPSGTGPLPPKLLGRLSPAAPAETDRAPDARWSGRVGLRRQRHVPPSIASLRHRLAVLLARQLDLCPCCGRGQRPRQSATRS